MNPEANASREANDEPTAKEMAEESLASVLKPEAVWEMPEAVEPSVKEDPHWLWRSDTMVDPVEDWRSADSVLLMTLKASFPQLEQVTFWRSAVVLAVLSPDTNCGTRDTMLLMVSVVPSDVCTLSSVSVTQSSLALLSCKQAIWRTVG